MREPNEINLENLGNSKVLKNKKREYLKRKMNDMEKRNIINMFLEIRVHKKGFQVTANILTDENDDVVADAKSILNS